jgi:hypothetical protein
LYTAVSRENAFRLVQRNRDTSRKWLHGEKWDNFIPADLQRLFVSGTYISPAGHERINIKAETTIWADLGETSPGLLCEILCKQSSRSICEVKVKQSLYRLGQALSVPGG